MPCASAPTQPICDGPAWLIEGLRYAALAAAAATAWFFWRRNMFGTIVVGTVTLLALRVGPGW